jgi:lipoxygenase homology domain-containing protein 1
LCGRWLDKDKGDGRNMCKLMPSTDRVANSPSIALFMSNNTKCITHSFFFVCFVLIVVRYKVDVKTGDTRGAGADANVFIILHGETESSKKFKLESGGNNFERGQVDVFGIETFDIGELTKITIGHDGTGFGSGWFLDNVVIQDQTVHNKEYKFQCGRWLDKVFIFPTPYIIIYTIFQGKDDGKIERDFTVSETITDLKTLVYEVKVLTGDRRGAGTNAPVSIVLFGENGITSGPPKILQSGTDNFEQGMH